MKHYFKKTQKGFSLLETIVAIGILTTGILSVVALMSYNLNQASQLKNRVIATSLAQEGIEVVRNIRDTNWLRNRPFNDWDQDNVGAPGEEVEGSAWTHRKKITVDRTKVPATQTNFPVLISRTDANWRDTANGGKVGKSNGGDILFTSSDGTTKLNHEIEKYVPTTGELVAWVNVPILSASENTILYIYYGNAGAADQENPAGVWDAGFQAIWHLKEDPSGTAPQMKDSTANGRHGTSAGMNAANQVAGNTDGSLDFDGNNDRVDTSNFMSSGITQFTAQAWVYKTTTKDARIIYKNNVGNTGAPVLGLASGNDNRVRCRLRAADLTFVDLSAGTLPLNTWTFVACVYDGSSVRAYKDGVEVGSITQTGTLAATNDVVVLGQNETGSSVDRHWPGKIDEARLSNIARSSDWLLAEYNNQSSPSTFYSVSPDSIPFLPSKRVVITDDPDADGCPPTCTPGTTKDVTIKSVVTWNFATQMQSTELEERLYDWK